jgi:hypothetical protein
MDWQQCTTVMPPSAQQHNSGKFMDWWQCTAVMQKEAKQSNSNALPPAHELFERSLYKLKHDLLTSN